MLRRLFRAGIAHGLAATGADERIGRLNGALREPLILGYHRVLHDSVPLPAHGVPGMGVRTSTLERHLAFVARRRRVVSLDEMGAAIEAGAAGGLAAVTFDDGYADFRENAFPLLQRMGIPAGVFVVTQLLDGVHGFVHDRMYGALERAFRSGGRERVKILLSHQGPCEEALPLDPFTATRALLQSLEQAALSRFCAALEAEFGIDPEPPRSLSWDDVIQMSRAGITIGSHTRTHSLLTRESEARVIEETAVSRADLEARLGLPVTHFVYPDGAFDAAAVRAVSAAGYRYAYTGCRHRDPSHPLLTLSRRVLWEGSTLGAFGSFSADVLSSQLNGVFRLREGCASAHGALHTKTGRVSVTLVGPSLDVPGGQSIQAAALMTGLRREGFDASFLPTNPRFPKGFKWLRRVPIARTLVNEALYGLSLRRLRGTDVVHVFSASFWSFLLAPVPAMLAARVFGKRVVLNYHSGEAAEHLRDWSGLVHPWLRLAHQIVVPSEYLRQIFQHHGYRSRVVRNVVDTSCFGYRERAPLKPRLLSTRTLDPNYGVDAVVRAFAMLKAERPDATLVIAGSGTDEARLRSMTDGLPGVTFLGRVRPERVPELCASADLFLNASIVDNQPLSLLEAFASGLPVVTTDTGGIAAMLKDGESGMIVPAADPAAMVTAVRALLADDALALRVARGARLIAEAHSWARVRHEWTEVYDGLTTAIPRRISGALGEERRC